MASYVTPKKNTAFIFYASLVSQADTKLMKSSPTLASGDFKVSIDGGSLTNLATLPTNTPGGVMVKFSLSSGEMNGDNITVVCSDASGAEWCDAVFNIQTSAQQIDDLSTPAHVLTQVNAALDAANAELSTIPGDTASLREAIQITRQYLLYKRTTTATTETLYKANSSTSLGTSTVSNNGTTATHGKVA